MVPQGNGSISASKMNSIPDSFELKIILCDNMTFWKCGVFIIDQGSVKGPPVHVWQNPIMLGCIPQCWTFLQHVRPLAPLYCKEWGWATDGMCVSRKIQCECAVGFSFEDRRYWKRLEMYKLGFLGLRPPVSNLSCNFLPKIDLPLPSDGCMRCGLPPRAPLHAGKNSMLTISLWPRML